MKKRELAIIALSVLTVVLLCSGSYFAWEGITHKGQGAWLFGGAEPGTGGQIETDEHLAVVSQSQYKRNCYATAVVFFLISAGTFWEAVKRKRISNKVTT
jgi:hypothetical protein